MKHTTHIRLGLLTLLLLALLAVPAVAAAKVQVAAPTRVTAGESFPVSANVPRGTESVAFFVDDRRAAVDRSPAWTLPADTLTGLRSGRHTISIRARRGGRIYGARRVVVVAPSTSSAAPTSTPVSKTTPVSTAPAATTTPVVDTPTPIHLPSAPEGSGAEIVTEARPAPVSTPPAPTSPETPSAPITPETPSTPVTPETPEVVTPEVGSLFPTFMSSSLGSFSNIQAAPGAITETTDPLGSGEKVLKMTVNNKDVAPITPTENPRAQAIAGTRIEPGDEFWLETKFMIPADTPSIPGWMALVAVYGAPFAGSGPWGIAVTENEFRWQRNGTYSWDIPWRAPLIKGSWVTVLMHQRFGTDGWVEMWINGEKISFFRPGNYNPLHEAETQKLAMKTMDSSNSIGPNAAKIMQYRQAGMFETASVYFGALRLGPTRTSVGA